MVLIKLTNPTDPSLECEAPSLTKKLATLVRPCERYKEMYKACKSIKHRVHQYYVYGELLDCNIYNDLHNHCMNYRKKRDEILLDPIIDWERNFILTRLKTETQNKVWELRDKPPEDFDAPLPEYLQKLHQNSKFKEDE